MAETVILDSEAVHALAQPKHRGILARRADVVLRVALERRALIRVPAPVLAEVCRGPRFDAAVEHLLNNRGIGVTDLTRQIAQRAGALLAEARMSSDHAVDAFVAATALDHDASVIVTGDQRDMRRLLARHPQIQVFGI
ncbi:MAG TPA: PIN domain-containing protein [Polyangiaceae bacterium]|nr:PIN domain-containing protein [Polyangiaceae bacterium]